MASNIYTKNEILQALASKGYFIDIYTLETFFAKWNIEAIFEDEQGGEFYDKNALNTVLNNLFNSKNDEQKSVNPPKEAPEVKPVVQAPVENVAPAVVPKKVQPVQNNINITADEETKNILENISLSDGSPLISKVQDNLNLNIDFNIDTPNENINIQETPQIENSIESDLDIFPVRHKKNKKTGILEGALQDFDPKNQQESLRDPAQEQEILKEIEKMERTIEDFQEQTEQIVPENNTLNIKEETPPMPALPVQEESDEEENKDFDDIGLISDSLEVQEKFKEYVASQVAKNQPSPPPPQNSNEFKLDISERTINMIARTMAKKIAKHVSAICSADAKSAAELAEVKQENKKLEQRAKELENQIKKLRLLLAESNKNLNSYKPSIFGLYKKVPPQQ